MNMETRCESNLHSNQEIQAQQVCNPRGQHNMKVLVLGRKNEQAVRSLESRDHTDAINALVEALNINAHMDGDINLICDCDICSLEECMVYSEAPRRYYLPTPPTSQGISMYPNRIETTAGISTKDNYYNSSDSTEIVGYSGSTESVSFSSFIKSPDIDVENHEDRGFVYSKAIRLTPTSLLDYDHWVGKYTMQVILTFNLALAHHLQYICDPQRRSSEDLTRILRLYEYAHEWQSEGDVRSIRFSMIMGNNLSEIYRIRANQEKYYACLDLVLSGVLCLLDDYEYNNEYETAEVESESLLMELDGFIRNT